MPRQNEHTPRIFLCHASEDKPRVMELYHRLKAAGYHPWLDKHDLLPGQNWRREIEKIIRDPYNLILVCLSRNSVSKRGVVQQEIKWALDILDQMPEETIYLIPVRLEVCQAPNQLSDLQWVDLFEPEGFDYLKRALDYELGKRPLPAEPASVAPAAVVKQPKPEPTPTKLPKILPPQRSFEPELILIPAGEFLMGSDPKKDKQANEDEQPQHRLYLPDYYIAKTPVTNAQYRAFVQAGHKSPGGWQDKQPPEGKENHPVVYVFWNDAVAYCKWLAKTTGKPYRLPTEAEWEKAARGSDGRLYPWGNEWDARRCNTIEGDKGGTTPVGAYPTGASPYGVLDMTGNVWEWCATGWGKPYPYDVAEDEWTDDYLKAGGVRVVRGGAFYSLEDLARCALRYGLNPDFGSLNIGFRLVVSPIL